MTKIKFTLETLPNISDFISAQIPFKEMIKDNGIYETDFINGSNMSIGVSFETNDDGEEVYIYNVFAGDNYINIDEAGNKENIMPDSVINEILEKLLSIEHIIQ